MESNNIQASSILSLFQTNNEQRQSFVAQIIDSIKNGKLSALNVHLQLKCMGIISEMITEDKAFKEAIKNDGVVSMGSEVIKVTKCSGCPMLVIDGAYNEYHSCLHGAFENLELFDERQLLESTIHPNCPLKGQSITYKIGESNE